jgi:hypothetical protein
MKALKTLITHKYFYYAIITGITLGAGLHYIISHIQPIDPLTLLGISL